MKYILNLILAMVFSSSFATTINKGDMLAGAGNGSSLTIVSAPANDNMLIADSTQTGGWKAKPKTDFLQTANNLSDVTASTALSNLGIANALVGSNSYASQSRSFATNYTPSASRDTFVVVTCKVVSSIGQTSTIDVLVNGVTISSNLNANALTVALGSMTQSIPFSFLVPAGQTYRINASGTATNTLVSVYEKTL